jgi:hypothetical protein
MERIVNPAEPEPSRASIGQDSDFQPEIASEKWSKSKLLRLPLLFLVLSIAFVAVFGWYVHDAMLAENPPVNILLSASNTNILVSVLSQAFAMVLQLLYSEIFNFLRWQLASRDGGVSASTFFTLSQATGLMPVFLFTIAKWLYSWGLIRYVHQRLFVLQL